MKSFLAAILAALIATPVAAADLHADPATYWTALAKTAQPGDTVWLASGTYPDPKLYNVSRAAPGVTVKPEPGAKAVFTGLSVNTSDGLTFEGIEVNGQVTFANSSRGGITHSLIRGQGDDFPNGVMLRNGADLTVTDNEFTHVGIAVAAYDNRVGGITISRNTIHEIAGPDAIDVFSSVKVIACDNTIIDIAPPPGSHPDALQVDSPVAGGARTTDVTICRNSYVRGTRGITVGGVFQPSSAAQGIPFVGHADNLIVRGNSNFGSMYNAQSFSDVHTALVEDNFNQGYDPYPANVVVRGGSSDVTIRNTVANSIGPYVPAGDPPLVNLQLTGNTLIPMASGAGDTSRLTAWLTARAPVPTPAPPPIVVAAPPPPSPAPPTVDPRDAQIADLTARLQVATSQMVDLAARLAVQADAAQLHATMLGDQLAVAVAALTADAAQLAEIHTWALAGRKARAKNVWLDKIIVGSAPH